MKVLFIDIDTLRPDHMGCYGYKRNTTPNMDKIAEEGVKFTNYYCSDAPCLPSRASLISGRFGIKNGAVGHGGTCGDMRLYGAERDFKCKYDLDNFNNIFRRAGYHCTSISTFPERHSSWWFSAGFNETYNVGKCGSESGEEVLPVALDWLERNKDKDDWFLHVHLWDPHTPYRAPADFGNPFENDELDTWMTQEILDEQKSWSAPHGVWDVAMYDDKISPEFPRQPGKVMNMEEYKFLIDNYDCGIKYADFLVGQIFDKLKDNKQFEDTAIIITSDHGENMGELGIYAEHGTADNITCNIPMIVKWPNAMKNKVDNGLHYSLDLLPTVADLLSVDKCDIWDGTSYAKTITDGEDLGRESVVISQMAHICQRSARFGDYLYVRTYHDGFRLFDKEMLFNLKEDPHEQFDIKDKYPEICAKGAKYILDWHDEAMLTSDSVIDPMWTVISEGGPAHTKGQLDRYLKRLGETGREEAAKKLAKRHKKG